MKIYWYLGHEQFQPETLVEQARAAEAAGFDGVMVSEHFMPWVDDVGAGGFAWATLGAIAAVTARLELAVVTTPLWRYHPAVVAQAAATIDRLCGGRFSLCVGTGENINEGPLGYNFPPYAERAARMDEALQIMRRLLDSKRLDFDGQFYTTKAAKLYSPPQGRVPIYLAAGGPKSAALAGERADGVLVSVKPDSDADVKVLAPGAEAARAAGREQPLVAATYWTVRGRNDAEAWDALKAWRGLRAPRRLTIADPAELQREADALPRSEILSRYQMVDTAADYVSAYSDIVRRFRPDILGIQTTSANQLETLKMVGREVAPELRKLSKQGGAK